MSTIAYNIIKILITILFLCKKNYNKSTNLNHSKEHTTIKNNNKGVVNKTMIKSRVDRDKTKRINSLVSEGLDEILGQVNKLERVMYNKFNIQQSEIIELIKNKKLDDVKLSLKYMLLLAFFDITQNQDYKMDAFYNSEVKLKFLNRYPNNTQTPYARIFEYSKELENKYERDLSEFKISEIEMVLKKLNPLTESASHVNGRIITAYIDWCVENHETNAKDNELKLKPVNYFNQFVDENIKLFYSKKDIERILWDCINPQDAVIIACLFEGIQGKSLAEIRNIKKEHVEQAINNDNVIYVYDEDNRKRKVKLEDSTIKLLVDAGRKNEYYKKNNQIENENVGTITNLVENDYVIRTSITRTDFANRPADKMVIYRRVKIISDFLDDPCLTAKNIVRSGVIYEAHLKYLEKGNLTKEDYLEICAKYDIENWYPVKKYCNPEIIKSLYEEYYR